MSAATATGDWLLRGIVGQTRGGFSHDSEHDLALMVSDFLENGGSSGADSLCSSDSDSGLSDLRNLADKISFYKCSIPQHENDFLSLIHSLMQSIKDADLFPVKSGPCNASCTRFSLAKLLRLSGHDAAVCVSRWQGSSKVPGGMRSCFKASVVYFFRGEPKENGFWHLPDLGSKSGSKI
uniref:Uncharacterized protein n=1 Tax=Rhizophora mucronata TaxID=61149 RepID=A0A2P2KIT0_RHIMU